MAHAYTPGLKVTQGERLRRRRLLPLKGEVLVEVGEEVNSERVVARTFLPGRVEVLNLANQLGVDQSDVPSLMLKQQGDRCQEGEVIAVARSFFGLFRSQATAPISGTVESISGVTGQVIFQGEPVAVQVLAYIRGTVVEVMPQEGVVVETCGTFVQGIFGIGGETSGPIAMVCSSHTEVLDGPQVGPEHRGQVLVGGSLVTATALRKAVEVGASGVVAGGLDDEDLREFLGYDLGVAITGHEQLGVTLVITEGFGSIDMAPQTFSLLREHEGELASINGATQIRAGVIRPEVIIPAPGCQLAPRDAAVGLGMRVGSRVRVIRSPYFGLLGTVVALPSDPALLESGSKARAVEVALEARGGETLLLPRANVELIESRG